MTDLLQELESMRSELHQSMKMLRQNGERLAQAEHDYQVEKAQTWLVLKDKGCTSTELASTIKGQATVAQAMLKRDIAKAMYEANQEHINVVKLEMRVLESQINREWNSNG